MTLDLEEGRCIEAEIRYSTHEREKFHLYYMDIPDGMTVYVENQNDRKIRINCGGDIIYIAKGERKEVMTGYRPDFMEFAKHSMDLPKNLEQFEERTVIQGLKCNDAISLCKNYMLFRRVEEKMKQGRGTRAFS